MEERAEQPLPPELPKPEFDVKEASRRVRAAKNARFMRVRDRMINDILYQSGVPSQ